MNHKTNLGIRAVLHTARKWEKDLAGVLPAPGHYHPGNVRAGDCRRTRGAVGRTAWRNRGQFTVNANNGYTLQPVTDEMIEEIAAIDGVESYNTSHWTIVNLYHQDTLMKGTDEREYVADPFLWNRLL